MSGFNYEWLQRVYEETRNTPLDESLYSSHSAPAQAYEAQMAPRSPVYPEGFEATAAAYSISDWSQSQARSHPHSPPQHEPTPQVQIQDFTLLPSGQLSNENVAQIRGDWSLHDHDRHLDNNHLYSPTAMGSLHDAMSTCSQDSISIKTTPEIESLTRTDLQLPATETHESSPENARILHHWVQLGTVTTSRSIKQYIVDASTPERKLFFCAWQGCDHPLGFPNKSQLMTHVRSLHLQEKPFLCTTCRTFFARKQDAIRHVNTANSGKRYECGICEKSFARKSYRDSHQNLCIERRALLASASSSRSRV